MHSKASRLVTVFLAITLTVTGGTLIALNVAIASAGSASASPQHRAAQERVHRFERWATITKISNGYYYDAGQQNTHLVVTPVKHGLRYTDRHTDVLRTKPDSCDRKPAKVGLVVVCHVPRGTGPHNPWTVKVFTRLGNDYVEHQRTSCGVPACTVCAIKAMTPMSAAWATTSSTAHRDVTTCRVVPEKT